MLDMEWWRREPAADWEQALNAESLESDSPAGRGGHLCGAAVWERGCCQRDGGTIRSLWDSRRSQEEAGVGPPGSTADRSVHAFWLLVQKCKGGTWFRSAFSSVNLGPSALQRTSALLRNSACLCRRSIAGRAALLARQRCPASRWRVVLGIPTPTVGLLLVPAGTVFRMAFLASLRDALVWPVPVPGVPLGPPRRTASLYPPANLLPSLRDGFRTPAGLFEASLDGIPKGCGDISRG